MGEEAGEPGEAIRFHEQIQEVQQAIALTDEVFDPVQTLGFGLGCQACHRQQPAFLTGCRGIEVHIRVPR